MWVLEHAHRAVKQIFEISIDGKSASRTVRAALIEKESKFRSVWLVSRMLYTYLKDCSEGEYIVSSCLLYSQVNGNCTD